MVRTMTTIRSDSIWIIWIWTYRLVSIRFQSRATEVSETLHLPLGLARMLAADEDDLVLRDE